MLIDAMPSDIKEWKACTVFYFGATEKDLDRLPVGSVYGVVKSPYSLPMNGHHRANLWTYTRFRIVLNNRGRWHQVESQRFLTEEEIAHFEARMVDGFR